ncbi:hypothetical protein [Plantibacter sp. CFBP 13570]|uniref:hypothetical protein n=1 Tax=Plantibacter sp. CFBP 13570 TaxID=2775272 RepID=UPI001930A3DC|nr:hypothetical protein [Plantibacter sp. CFBP 13570]MBD8533846.1 hypothetical protein [Plantibacter sp. CFBP 13570]
MADSETQASDTQDSRVLQAELLRLRDALEGAEAEARAARARAQAASVELDGLPLAHENLRLRDELAHARVTAHYFESLYLRVSAERERDHEKLVNEFTGSRTWRIGAAVMSPLGIAKRVRGKRS